MPGIVGLITRMPRERAERQLVAMLGTMLHEPFYVTGTWIDESLGVYVGWSAQKGSFADGMPLLNEKGDLVLVFAGEDFPEPGTAARLTARGHTLGSAEASYLVHLYEEDPRFPAGLNGFFHGLLADRAAGDSHPSERPLRHAAPVLPRIEGRFLLRRGSEGDSCRSPRATLVGPGEPGGANRLGGGSREQVFISRDFRNAGGFALEVSKRCHRTPGHLF